MTWRDKLEIGLKEDAPFRRDNLPDFQKKPAGPETNADDPTRSAEEPGAREDAEAAPSPLDGVARPATHKGSRARP